MSIYYLDADLNTYRSTPYFQSQCYTSYPLTEVMQSARAFRRLPPNLRKLCALAKRWAVRNYGHTPGDIDRYYDAEGYELDLNTGVRLTDEQIDSGWGGARPNTIEVDITEPPGGFMDPDKWEEVQPSPDVDDREDDGITKKQLLKDIRGYGREYVATDYGIPSDRIRNIKTNEQLADLILLMHGRK